MDQTDQIGLIYYMVNVKDDTNYMKDELALIDSNIFKEQYIIIHSRLRPLQYPETPAFAY